MPTRWEITKAVRTSTLPAPSRLVMLVLADVAEVGTAEIPARFTPSLRVLAEETGLDRSTVKRHLASLETAGWIVRTRPNDTAQWNGERTRYRLDFPAEVDPTEQGEDGATPGAQSAQGGRTGRPGVGAQDAQGGRTERPGVGAESTRGRRTVRHLYTDLSDQYLIYSDPPSKPEEVDPERLDIETICRHLADKVEANGSKRPKITKRWRDSARLLLDEDGRTVEQVKGCIDWCQNDVFWRANVLSMPKLREKYDQLRLAAQRDSNNGFQPYRNNLTRDYHEAL